MDNMSHDFSGDEVAEGLLRAAAELQSFAASVLGLELDYVTPDIQGSTGWIGGARSPGKQPVILHFRLTTIPVIAPSTCQPSSTLTAPSPNTTSVSLQQYLDEIPAEILPNERPEPPPPHLPHSSAASSHALTSSDQTALRSLPPLPPCQYPQPEHPNLAVLYDAIHDSDLLRSGGVLGHPQLTTNPHVPAIPYAVHDLLTTTPLEATVTTAPAPAYPLDPTPVLASPAARSRPGGLHHGGSSTPALAPSPPPPTSSTSTAECYIGASWHPGCSLADCLHSPAVAALCGLYGTSSGGGGGGGGGEAHLRFLLLQLVAATCHAHAHGVGLGGGISPSTVLLAPGGWVQVLPPPPASPPPSPTETLISSQSANPTSTPSSLPLTEISPTQPLPHQPQPPQPSPLHQAPPSCPSLPRLPACLRHGPPPLTALTVAWQHHALSSLDYLMLLNLMVGRRLGDRTHHPFVPWVADFTRHPADMLGGRKGGPVGAGVGAGGSGGMGVGGSEASLSFGASSGGAGSGPNSEVFFSGGGGGGGDGRGWLDLTRSRYRQVKGDVQLDATYGTSQVPYHIPHEPLTELSYCIYLARVTRREVLTSAVRSHFEPREYPSSVPGMLAVSPDECLPQLYTDPDIFRSIHPELPDLQLPPWATSAEDFISWHRALLESDHVSQHLHHWLDLMFGYKLVGPQAVAAKNVYLTNRAQGHNIMPAAAAGGAVGGLMAGCEEAAAAAGTAVELPYAPGGMHAPLFRTPHPPRLPRRGTGEGCNAGGVGGSGGGWVGIGSVGRSRSSSGGGGSGVTSSSGAAGDGATDVLAALDSLELMGAIAANCDGGIVVHPEEYVRSAAVQQVRRTTRVGNRHCSLPPSNLSARHYPHHHSHHNHHHGRQQQDNHHHQAGMGGVWGQVEGTGGYPWGERGPVRRHDVAGGVVAGERAQVTSSAGSEWRSGGGGRSEGVWATTPQRGSQSSSHGDGDNEEGSGSGVVGGGSGGGCRTGADEPHVSVLSLRESKRRDCQAIGALAVQLYLGRSCFSSFSHSSYWLRLATQLPAAARRFVRLCFHAQVTTEQLLSDPFFSPGLHAAHKLLRTTLYDIERRPPYPSLLRYRRKVPHQPAGMPPPDEDVSPSSSSLSYSSRKSPDLIIQADAQSNTGNGNGALAAPPPPPSVRPPPPPQHHLPSQLAALAAAADSGKLDEMAKQRSALELCLPHIMRVLWQAAVHSRVGGGGLISVSDGVSDRRTDSSRQHNAGGQWREQGRRTGRSLSDSVASMATSTTAAAAAVARSSYSSSSSLYTSSPLRVATASNSSQRPAGALVTRMSHDVYDIFQALLRLLPPDKVTAHPLPYVCCCLSYILDHPAEDAVVVRDANRTTSPSRGQRHPPPPPTSCGAVPGSAAGTMPTSPLTTLSPPSSYGKTSDAAGQSGGGDGRGGGQNHHRRYPPAIACSGALVLPLTLLSAGLQAQLLKGSHLDAYVQTALPIIISALMCAQEGPMTLAFDDNEAGSEGGGVSTGAVSTVSDAAAATLLMLAGRLPLPLLLERVVRPLLTSLTLAPVVPRLLVQLVGDLGGPLTARHIAPVLLQLAVVPAPLPVPEAVKTAGGRTGGSGSGSGGVRHHSFTGVRGSGVKAAALGSYARSTSIGRASTTYGSSPPPSAAAVDTALQQQIYTALSVLNAVLNILPREFLPRVFLHGLSPAPQPPPAASSASSGTSSIDASSTTTVAPSSASSSSLPSPRTGAGGGAAAASASGSASNVSGGLPPLLSCLLDPMAFRVAPGSLTMLAGLALRAFARLARPENLAWVLLPHLMPLLAHAATPLRRAAYRANGTAQQRPDVCPSSDQGDGGGGAVRTATLYGGGVGKAATASGGADGSTGLGGVVHRMHSSGCVDDDVVGSGEAVSEGALEADVEDGYWELVQCVYGHLIESSGLLTVRNLLPGCQSLEAGLAARWGWSPTLTGGWVLTGGSTGGSGFGLATGGGVGGGILDERPPRRASSEAAADAYGGKLGGSAGGGGGSGSAGRLLYASLESQVRQEIASKQQHLAALHGTHLFIKEVGWSAPTSLATTAARLAAKEGASSGAVGGGGGAAGGGGGGKGTSAAPQRQVSMTTAAAGGSGGSVGSGGHGGIAGGGGLSGASRGGGASGGLGTALGLMTAVAARSEAVAAAAADFLWTPMLVIGSPTVAEGLAVRSSSSGGGKGNGGGGGSRASLSGSTHAGGRGRSGGAPFSALRGGRPTGSGVDGGAAAATAGTIDKAPASVSVGNPHPHHERTTTWHAGGGRSPTIASHDDGPSHALTDEPPDATAPRWQSSPSVVHDGAAAGSAAADASLVAAGGASLFDSAAAAAAEAAAATIMPGTESVSGPVTGTSPVAAACVPPAPCLKVELPVIRSDPGPLTAPTSPPTASPPPSTSELWSDGQSSHHSNRGAAATSAAAVGAAAGNTSPPLPTPRSAASPSIRTSPVASSAPSSPPVSSPLLQRMQQHGSDATLPLAAAAAAAYGGGPRVSSSGAPLPHPLLILPPVLPEHQVADSGSQRWAWLPPLPLEVSQTISPAAAPTFGSTSATMAVMRQGAASGRDGGGGSRSSGGAARRARLLVAAATPPASDVWSLQATVVHSWPAHRDRIRALAVHSDECGVLTAGRGAVSGREGPIVRVWSLADCQARVQYGGHRSAVQALLVLRAARAGGAVVASLDAAGQIHIWSYDNGQQLGVFASGSIGTGSAGAGGGCGCGGGSTGDGADVEPGVTVWRDLMDRSGQYLNSQHPEPVGWQTMGGLKTSRQLSAASTAATPLSTTTAGGGGGGGGVTSLLTPSLAATAAAQLTTVAASVAAAAVTGSGSVRQQTTGFTAMCNAVDEHRVLYAGTVDARLCALDLERCRILSEWLVAPAVRYDPDDAVTALCTPSAAAAATSTWDPLAAAVPSALTSGAAAAPWLCPEVVAAGSRTGRVLVVDRRCGSAALAFRSHSGEVTSMASYGSHMLITAGGDKLLRLWDLRRAGSGSGGGSGGAWQAGSVGAVGTGYDIRTGPWSGWEGHRGGGGVIGEPLWGVVDAFSPIAVGAAVQGSSALYDRIGARAGMFEVQLPPPPSAYSQPSITAQQQQLALGDGAASPALLRSMTLPREGVQSLRVLRDCVLMASGSSVGVLALNGADIGGGGVGAGGSGASNTAAPSFTKLRNARGGREGAAITGLAVLPCCRLLVAAGDDGVVRICR